MEDEGLQTQPETDIKAEQKPTENTKNTIKESSNSNAGIVIALLIAILLAVAGVVLGVTSLIKSNQALSQLNETSVVEDAGEDFLYEDDESGSSDYITILYNDGKDYVDIFDGGMDYYTISNNDQVINREVNKDTSQILADIKDNYVGNMTDEEVDENATWSIEVGTYDNDYIASGTGTPPEWFTNILNQLELDKYGYQSKNL